MSISKIEKVNTKETENEIELVNMENEIVFSENSLYADENSAFLAEYDTDEKQIDYYTEKMYNLLEEFQIDYSFTMDGCKKNVVAWYNNKKNLFNLLRKHPMWNEEAKGIVFLKTEMRNIDSNIYIRDFENLLNFLEPIGDTKIIETLRQNEEFSCFNVTDDMSRDIINTQNCRLLKLAKCFSSYFNMISNLIYDIKPKQFITDNDANYINCRFKKDNNHPFCKSGEKLSRVLNRIFTNVEYVVATKNNFIKFMKENAYSDVTDEELSIISNYWFRHANTEYMDNEKTGLETIVKFDSTKFKSDDNTFDKLFAKVANDCNPLQIEKITCLSLSILDFLTMSYGNSWASCHYINSNNYKLNLKGDNTSYNGCYKAGTLSYANDKNTMIFYTLSDKYQGNEYHLQPKINRQLFHYMDGTLIQSRLYPSTDNVSLSEQYRPVVQSIISECENKPNLWLLNRNTSVVFNHALTNKNTFHYHDYEYEHFRPNVSRLKGYNMSNIDIGGNSYCVDCGELKTDRNSSEKNLQCNSCTSNNKKNRFVCEECGEIIDIRTDSYFEYDGLYYCAECFFYCEEHEVYEPINQEPRTVNPNTNCEYRICQDAYENYSRYQMCEHCNEIYDSDHFSTVDGCHYCDDCYNNLFTECYECGNPIYNNEIIYDDVTGESYCSRCYEELISSREEANESEDN